MQQFGIVPLSCSLLLCIISSRETAVVLKPCNQFESVQFLDKRLDLVDTTFIKGRVDTTFIKGRVDTTFIRGSDTILFYQRYLGPCGYNSILSEVFGALWI
jgi:hypothetical protein